MGISDKLPSRDLGPLREAIHGLAQDSHLRGVRGRRIVQEDSGTIRNHENNVLWYKVDIALPVHCRCPAVHVLGRRMDLRGQKPCWEPACAE
jgi:hypothetical protein